MRFWHRLLNLTVNAFERVVVYLAVGVVEEVLVKQEQWVSFNVYVVNR